MLSRMFKKISPVLFVLAILVCGGLYSEANAQVVARLVSPPAGSIVVPGQQITVSWDITINPMGGGKKGGGTVIPTYVEQEVYASFDGGNTYELITPELSSTERSFTWTVPNLPGKSVLLDIRCGNGVRGPEFFNKQPVFQILGGKKVSVNSIALNKIENRKVTPGETIEIGWDVNFDNIENFDVKVSYDEGLHMQKIATTKEHSITWTVPEDISSSRIVFQVTARTTDGRKFVTRIPVNPMLIVE
ncbi:MAG: hypothetical protein HY819_13825 [Acidobacteria bacterium]|nr:hypothetical protein [Acidobacteriota bacterium]